MNATPWPKGHNLRAEALQSIRERGLPPDQERLLIAWMEAEHACHDLPYNHLAHSQAKDAMRRYLASKGTA